jgi:anti-anti-sigma factor
VNEQVTQLRVDVVPDPTGPTVVLAGEIDLATAPELQARLGSVAEGTNSDVMLDLAQLTFLDSTGLHAIATLYERLRTESRTLRVCEPSPRVRRVLELSGMARLLEIGPAVAPTRR